MSHLTFEQRYTISVMYQSGKKKCEIAAMIGKNKSVITREISRNCDKRSKKCDADSNEILALFERNLRS